MSVLALRLIHIVCGVIWVGGVLFIAWFLIPTIRGVGPAGGPVMSHIVQVRRLPLVMMVVAILTVLSGLALYWRDSAGFHGAWMQTGTGIVFSFGALLGLASVAVGMAVSSPVGRRLGLLAAAAQAKGGPPSAEEAAEMQRLQARLAAASNLVAALLVLATAAMAVARYVP
jgi:uncharacterized membrane protein